jgi:hypothetical protein
MVELSGSLGGVDLLPIIRLLAELRQTGSLQLSRGDWSARLDLRDGRVVAASFAEERGLGALTALGLVMRDAEFTYMEGPSPIAADLDLTPERVRGHLETPAGIGVLALDSVPRSSTGSNQSTSNGDGDQVVLQRETISRLLAIDGRRTLGEIVGSRPSLPLLLDLAHLIELGLIRLDPPLQNALNPSPQPERALPITVPALADIASRSTLIPVPATPIPAVACPKLGFADDPMSHFSRPTAVHRCYANGPQEAVSTLEQREFCLSERYGTCPRLRAAIADAANATPLVTSSSTNGHAPAPVAAPVTTAATAAPTDTRLLVTAVSIVLTIGALVAVFVAFIRPAFQPAPPAAAPVIVATLALTPIATQAPTVQVVAPTVLPTLAQPTPLPVAKPTQLAQVVRTATTAVIAPAAPTVPQTLPGPIADGDVGRSIVGSVLLDTLFREPQPGWIENVPFAGWYSGAYMLAARVAPRFVAVAAPQSQALRDVVVSGTFHKVGGPPGGGYGFVLRDQEPAQRDGANQAGHFYVVEVGDRGQIGMWRRDDTRWVDLLTWTDSPAVRPGNATNELALRAIGDQFTLLVNGREVMTQTDSTLATGGIGIYVGGDNNEVAVDRFTVVTPLS